jgi:hypothetical protein
MTPDEHRQFLETLNPYVQLDVRKALDLIRARPIDLCLCFIDPDLSGAKRELDLVRNFFSIAKPIEINKFWNIEPTGRIFQQGEHRGQNILLWFATHCNGEELHIGTPPSSSWQIWDLLFLLNQIKHGGFEEIFIFFNVCFSQGLSSILRDSFIDMQSGMTLGSSKVHFFLHRHLMAVSDSNNAAQSVMSENPPESDDSRVSRDRARNALEFTELMMGFDRDISYVYIAPGTSREEDDSFWSSVDKNV